MNERQRNSYVAGLGAYPTPGHLEKKKSVRFKDDVEFHSYIQRGPSIDNLLDLLDNSGNVKTYDNKYTPPPETASYVFTPKNFARPKEVPDSIQLAADLALVSLAYKGSFVTGTILIKNLAFQKAVYVRYTTDEWNNHKEVVATHFKHLNGIDSFRFLLQVDVPKGYNSRQYLKFCIRGEIGGREIWDNNGNKDYILTVDSPKGN